MPTWPWRPQTWLESASEPAASLLPTGTRPGKNRLQTGTRGPASEASLSLAHMRVFDSGVPWIERHIMVPEMLKCFYKVRLRINEFQ